MTAFCVWLAIEVNRVRRQREALVAIQNAGGRVFYDFHRVFYDSQKITPSSFPYYWDPKKRPAGPRWLRSRLGDDYFHNPRARGR